MVYPTGTIMLVKRTCPVCKSELNLNDIFFCSSCGNVLPDNLQLKKLSMRNVKEVEAPDAKVVVVVKSIKKVSKSLVDKSNLRNVSVVAGIFILLCAALYLAVRLTFPNVSKLTKNIEIIKPKVTQPKGTSKTYKNTLVMDLTLKNGSLGQKGVYDYVPFDVDFYSEFNGFESLKTYFGFVSKDLVTLVDNLSDKSPFYAVFSMSKNKIRGWVLLIFSTNTVNNEDYKSLAVRKIGGALVISDNAQLVDEVKASKDGSAKSLALNPFFISMRFLLPTEGKAFIFTPIEGSKAVLQELLGKTSSDELKSIIETFKSNGSNYLVIQ